MKLKLLIAGLISLAGSLSFAFSAHAKPVQIGEWLMDCRTGRPIDPNDAKLIPGGVAAQSDIRRMNESPIASESMPEDESNEPENQQEEPPENEQEDQGEGEYEGEETEE